MPYHLEHESFCVGSPLDALSEDIALLEGIPVFLLKTNTYF